MKPLTGNLDRMMMVRASANEIKRADFTPEKERTMPGGERAVQLGKARQFSIRKRESEREGLGLLGAFKHSFCQV